MDIFFRVLLYLLLAVFLIIVNIWFIQSVRSSFFKSGIIIAPFEVSGTDGIKGTNLAQMLRSQLSHLQKKIEKSQIAIVEKPREARRLENDPATTTTILLPSLVELPAAVFEPVQLNVKVGGVEVGGVVSWIQRSLVKPRIINFTTYVDGDKATTTGNLEAFGYFTDADLWIESTSKASDIAKAAAHALIQRKLSEDGFDQIDVFSRKEFEELLNCLFTLGELNRLVSEGRVVKEEYVEQFKTLVVLTEITPNWYELTYLTANVADKAGYPERAIYFYQKLKQIENNGKADHISEEVKTIVDNKLNALPTNVEQVSLSAGKEELIKDAVNAYATSLDIEPSSIKTKFKVPQYGGAIAIWNTEEKTYEINPKVLDSPGLDRYIVLMGNFFNKNYHKCLGTLEQPSQINAQFWNEFRYSIIDYIISSDPDGPGKSYEIINPYSPLFRTFEQLEAGQAIVKEDLRKLAFALLDNYDCDWSFENLADKIVETTKNLHLADPETILIEDTFRSSLQKQAR